MNKQYESLKANMIYEWQLGKSITAIANETKISRSTIYRWINDSKINQSKRNNPINKRLHAWKKELIV